MQINEHQPYNESYLSKLGAQYRQLRHSEWHENTLSYTIIPLAHMKQKHMS